MNKHKKGLVAPLYALPDESIAALKQAARRLCNINKALSRRQWVLSKLVLTDWQAHPDYAYEMTLDEFYCECSRVLCDTAGYAIVTTTGETLKTWCEVYKHFEQTPEKMKAEIPFEYFKQARWLCNHHFVVVAEAAIATALDHNLTADEMKRFYTGDTIPEPQVIEFRNLYPDYLWGLYGVVTGAKGNREQIEFHMREIVRLAAAE